MAEARLRRFEERAWTNWHRSVTTPILARYEVHNADAAPSMAGMCDTTRVIQGLIGEAQAAGVRLRVAGSKWSFSEVAAATDSWALDTPPINWSFRVSPASLSPGYSGDPESLFLVQAGLSIAELNKLLETSFGRSLRTTGASNGQTIPGAMGTGTHGSALDLGAIQCQVVGLQLIPGATRNLWIERATYPVASDTFVGRLEAELVRDDELFEAALVNLGGLGVVHAVMIETAPRFLLEASQFRRPYDATLRQAMDTADFSGIELPGGAERPYFLHVVRNPYDEVDAFVKVMYARECPADYAPDYRLSGEYGPGYDVPGLLGRLLDVAAPFTPAILAPLMSGQLKTFSDKRGTWGETFDYTTPRADTIGTGLAIPVAKTSQALDIVQAAFREGGPAPLIYACRFVAKSPGLLAFTRFDPTCVIDLDGLRSERALRLMEDIRQRFEAAGIPYAQHWGKLHGLTAERVRQSYGAGVDDWLAARGRLMPSEADRHTFSSAFLEGLGLA